jgi:hypothetical protein
MKKLVFVLAMVMTYGLSVATAGEAPCDDKKAKAKVTTVSNDAQVTTADLKADGSATVTMAAKADGCSGEKTAAKADGCSGDKAVTEVAGCSGDKTQAQASKNDDKAKTASLKVE